MEKVLNVISLLEIINISTYLLEIYSVLKSHSFFNYILMTLLRNTELGQKVKDITAKGDMVGTDLVIKVLLKAITTNHKCKVMYHNVFLFK